MSVAGTTVAVRASTKKRPLDQDIIVIADDDDNDRNQNVNGMEYSGNDGVNDAVPLATLRPRKRRNRDPQTTATAPSTSMGDDNAAAAAAGAAKNQCVARCLEVFPHIDIGHVTTLFDSHAGRVDHVIESIMMQDKYPVQTQPHLANPPDLATPPITVNLQASIDSYTDPARPHPDTGPRSHIEHLCRKAFPEIPRAYVREQTRQNIHLYQSYLSLANATRLDPLPYVPAQAYDSTRLDRRFQCPRATRIIRPIIDAHQRELQVAEAQSQILHAERDNLNNARLSQAMAICSTCFDDAPLNRMIPCEGDHVHFTCHDCMLVYIAAQIGDARSTVVCPDGSDPAPCKADFADYQLDTLPDKQLITKLRHLQQQQAVREAGLEDLAECPFCDYKAIYPPIHDYKEFRCENPTCMVVSCRSCVTETHAPLSCEEARANKGLASRHLIEEAMTEALVRKCNKCKSNFVKEAGCNQMTCTACGNRQCYLCGSDTADYLHFRAPDSKCALHDQISINARHDEEVQKAEVEARARVRAENPDIREEDLIIPAGPAPAVPAPAPYLPAGILAPAWNNPAALAPRPANLPPGIWNPAQENAAPQHPGLNMPRRQILQYMHQMRLQQRPPGLPQPQMRDGDAGRAPGEGMVMAPVFPIPDRAANVPIQPMMNVGPPRHYWPVMLQQLQQQRQRMLLEPEQQEHRLEWVTRQIEQVRRHIAVLHAGPVQIQPAPDMIGGPVQGQQVPARRQDGQPRANMIRPFDDVDPAQPDTGFVQTSKVQRDRATIRTPVKTRPMPQPIRQPPDYPAVDESRLDGYRIDQPDFSSRARQDTRGQDGQTQHYHTRRGGLAGPHEALADTEQIRERLYKRRDPARREPDRALRPEFGMAQHDAYQNERARLQPTQDRLDARQHRLDRMHQAYAEHMNNEARLQVYRHA